MVVSVYVADGGLRWRAGRQAVWGATLTFPFDPHALFFGASSGRLYHPAPLGARALVRSALALELLRDAQPNAAGTLTMPWRTGERIPIPTRDDS
jgi:hypothetical protein